MNSRSPWFKNIFFLGVLFWKLIVDAQSGLQAEPGHVDPLSIANQAAWQELQDISDRHNGETETLKEFTQRTFNRWKSVDPNARQGAYVQMALEFNKRGSQLRPIFRSLIDEFDLEVSRSVYNVPKEPIRSSRGWPNKSNGTAQTVYLSERTRIIASYLIVLKQNLHSWTPPYDPPPSVREFALYLGRRLDPFYAFSIHRFFHLSDKTRADFIASAWQSQNLREPHSSSSEDRGYPGMFLDAADWFQSPAYIDGSGHQVWTEPKGLEALSTWLRDRDYGRFKVLESIKLTRRVKEFLDVTPPEELTQKGADLLMSIFDNHSLAHPESQLKQIASLFMILRKSKMGGMVSPRQMALFYDDILTGFVNQLRDRLLSQALSPTRKDERDASLSLRLRATLLKVTAAREFLNRVLDEVQKVDPVSTHASDWKVDANPVSDQLLQYSLQKIDPAGDPGSQNHFLVTGVSGLMAGALVLGNVGGTFVPNLAHHTGAVAFAGLSGAFLCAVGLKMISKAIN